MDSIWTVFSADSGYGGGAHAVTTPKRPGQGNARNDTADVVYRYTKLGVVDSLLLPRIGVAVNYDYANRGWLDSITATQADGGVLPSSLPLHLPDWNLPFR